MTNFRLNRPSNDLVSLRRLEMLKSLRWEFGKDLPMNVLKNLSESERDWFKNYCNNLDSYMSRLNDGRGLDLTLQRKPPKRLYVQVRCLKEYGEFPLDDGTSVILSKDSTVSINMIFRTHVINVFAALPPTVTM